MGFRYRIHRPIVAGTRRRVDISFGPAKVAVFVDGCFWHGCPRHGSHVPKVNQDYWVEKIMKNKARDRDTDRKLRAAGWQIIRVWEHQDPDQAARRIAKSVLDRAPQKDGP
jgi:DNA mismatch endonuclease (patch repair protein)